MRTLVADKELRANRQYIRWRRWFSRTWQLADWIFLMYSSQWRNRQSNRLTGRLQSLDHLSGTLKMWKDYYISNNTSTQNMFQGRWYCNSISVYIFILSDTFIGVHKSTAYCSYLCWFMHNCCGHYSNSPVVLISRDMDKCAKHPFWLSDKRTALI